MFIRAKRSNGTPLRRCWCTAVYNIIRRPAAMFTALGIDIHLLNQSEFECAVHLPVRCPFSRPSVRMSVSLVLFLSVSQSACTLVSPTPDSATPNVSSCIHVSVSPSLRLFIHPYLRLIASSTLRRSSPPYVSPSMQC